jgi:hypothetical protein
MSEKLRAPSWGKIGLVAALGCVLLGNILSGCAPAQSRSGETPGATYSNDTYRYALPGGEQLEVPQVIKFDTGYECDLPPYIKAVTIPASSHPYGKVQQYVEPTGDPKVEPHVTGLGDVEVGAFYKEDGRALAEKETIYTCHALNLAYKYLQGVDPILRKFITDGAAGTMLPDKDINSIAVRPVITNPKYKPWDGSTESFGCVQVKAIKSMWEGGVIPGPRAITPDVSAALQMVAGGVQCLP